jgi:hypothetical protein
LACENLVVADFKTPFAASGKCKAVGDGCLSTAGGTTTVATESGSSSNGAIIGGAVGGGLVVALLAILALTFCWCRRRRDSRSRSQRKNPEEVVGGNEGTSSGVVDLKDSFVSSSPRPKTSAPTKLVPTPDASPVPGAGVSMFNTQLTSSTATTGTSCPSAGNYTIPPPTDYAANGMFSSTETRVYSLSTAPSDNVFPLPPAYHELSPAESPDTHLPPTPAMQGILGGTAPSVELSSDLRTTPGRKIPTPDAQWMRGNASGT